MEISDKGLFNMNEFYKNKKVLITGHTGFKGSWLSEILVNWGAEVSGFSLEPPTEPNLFSLLELDSKIDSHIGDIRDLEKLKNLFKETEPEIVMHLAAQPLVLEVMQVIIMLDQMMKIVLKLVN